MIFFREEEARLEGLKKKREGKNWKSGSWEESEEHMESFSCSFWGLDSIFFVRVFSEIFL